MPETPKIELRSDEVQEIMSHVPNWMIRRGIGLILLLIVMCLFITWFIKYPDVISGSATLSTEQPSIQILSKSGGEISKLYKRDHQKVKKGDLIAIVKNTLSEEAKVYLTEIIANIRSNTQQLNTQIQFNDAHLTFGALQADYSSLKTAVLDYDYFLKNNSLSTELALIGEQIRNHETLKEINYSQLNTSKQQQIRIAEKLKSDKWLLDQGVISKVEYNEELNKMNASENELNNLKKNAVQTSITLTDLKKQQFQLKNTYDKQKNDFIKKIQLHLGSIDNAIESWGRNFEIRALIDGELSFIEKVVENQYVTSGQALFAIVPDSRNFVGFILVPQAGFAKVKVGQKVRLKMDNYPAHEFGQLNAKVSSISLLPKEKQYRIEFRLTNGLISSYKRKLDYSPEMVGIADIITEDLRLSDRVFNTLKKNLVK